MPITGKLIFILIIFIMYTLSFVLSRNTSVRAIEKLFLSIFSISLIGAIIFSNQVWILLPRILQVKAGSDSVLYLFIIVSTSFNLIILRKFMEIENKLHKLIQRLSLNEIKDAKDKNSNNKSIS